MTYLSPAFRRRRPLAGLLTGALLFVSCASGETEAGGIERFCRAFTNVLTVTKGAGGGATSADTERDAAAALEALSDAAPGAVKDYLGAARELSALSKVWENPQTGGIKVEYVDDFQRLVGVLEDSTDATSRFVAERCPGAPLPEAPLSRFGDSPGGRPTGQAQVPSRPADVRVLLADGPAGSYERVTLDVAR